MDVDHSTFNAERIQAKEKKRVRRDSAKTKDHAPSVSGDHNMNVVSANGLAKRSGKIGDRKSRSLYGRGLPKKGGGGGKGTWGRPGDEIDQDGILDDHDPNYDSEEVDRDTVFKTVIPEWSSEEVEKTVTPILNEYFEHAQMSEVLESLRDLNIQGHKSLVIVYLITLAMERKSEFRELSSQLIKYFATPSHHNQKNVEASNGTTGQFLPPFLTVDDFLDGFSVLFENLPQLVLDTPDAAEVFGKFLARAIFDNVLPKEILNRYSEPNENYDKELTLNSVKEARCLLSIPHNNLRHVWGTAGGIQPLDVLKDKMTALLKEYLSSGDSEEAIRCVRDLDVPHYHHELVYELLVMAIEISTKRAISMLTHLLKRFCDTAIVTVDQLNQGILRVYAEIGEISIDVPNAYLYLEEFIEMCYDLKIVSNKLKLQAPKRSRKRFVSEGDGGRWKNSRDTYFDLV